MNIKPVHKTTFRAKQRTPRSLLEGLLPAAHFHVPGHFKEFALARNIDTNLNATMADVSEATAGGRV